MQVAMIRVLLSTLACALACLGGIQQGAERTYFVQATSSAVSSMAAGSGLMSVHQSGIASRGLVLQV